MEEEDLRAMNHILTTHFLGMCCLSLTLRVECEMCMHHLHTPHRMAGAVEAHDLKGVHELKVKVDGCSRALGEG